jgi:hypothetical protein
MAIVSGTVSAKAKRKLHARGFTIVERVGGRPEIVD